MKFFKTLMIFLLMIFIFSASVSWAQGAEDTIAYKLAVIHTKATDPESVLLKQSVQPSRVIITEFYWIMESLSNRCLNPEKAIADTIIETWQMVKEKGYDISLLEIARQLSQTARNRFLFGDEKVNFRMTTAYWVKQFQSQIKLKGK